MNEYFWQKILVSYKPAIFNYHIYNSVKKKIQVIHSVNVNKNNLFDHSQISSKEFADKKWQKWNDDKFKNTFSDINDPLPNKTKKENFFKFAHSIMSLPTPSLTSPQTSSDSNRSNEKNTASVRASDFEYINAQNKKDARSDIESAQSPNDFVEEEAGKPLANPLILSSIISTHQSSCTQLSIKYNISDYFDNIQYDSLKKILKVNVITVKLSISKSH